MINNERKNKAMMIRDEIIRSNSDFCQKDISGDGCCHRYLYDKVHDLLYIWYKQKREYDGWAIKPSKETFDELFSNHNEEKLREFYMRLFEDSVSRLEKTELLELMCKFLSGHEEEVLKEFILVILKDRISCMERSELIDRIYREYKDNLECA